MNDKRKKSGGYHQHAKKHKQYVLEPGLKGFLCTCNFQEKACVREAYNLLNKYADKIYGNELANSSNLKKKEEEEEVNEIEDDLQAELNQLKNDSSKSAVRRFQVVESGARNMLFIKTEVEDTVKLACEIVTEIYESQTQQSRHLIRLIPIEATCTANVQEISKTIQPLIEKKFKDSAQIFSIIINARNNNKLVKDDVIKAVADLVGATRSDHSVNLKQANISIVIEVIRNVALLSIIPNYLKYKKFNIIVDQVNEAVSKNDIINKEEEEEKAEGNKEENVNLNNEQEKNNEKAENKE